MDENMMDLKQFYDFWEFIIVSEETSTFNDETGRCDYAVIVISRIAIQSYCANDIINDKENTNIMGLFLQLSNDRKHHNSDFRWIQNTQNEFFGYNISQSTKIVISDESDDDLPKI
jgi:hypothetical protein